MVNEDQVGVFYVLVLIKIKLQLLFLRLTQQRMTSVLFPCFNTASCLYLNMLNLNASV